MPNTIFCYALIVALDLFQLHGATHIKEPEQAVIDTVMHDLQRACYEKRLQDFKEIFKKAYQEYPLLFCYTASASDDLHCLCIAVQGGVDYVRFLLTFQPLLNRRGVVGWTALHWAAYNNDVLSYQLLIDAGADIFVCNENGMTPYGLAKRYGRKAIVQLHQSKKYDETEGDYLEREQKKWYYPCFRAGDDGRMFFSSWGLQEPIKEFNDMQLYDELFEWETWGIIKKR